MNPRTWTRVQAGLFILGWLLLAPVAVVMLAGTGMWASGASGGLVGVSAGGLPLLAVVVLGPPGVVLLVRATRRP